MRSSRTCAISTLSDSRQPGLPGIRKSGWSLQKYRKRHIPYACPTAHGIWLCRAGNPMQYKQPSNAGTSRGLQECVMTGSGLPTCEHTLGGGTQSATLGVQCHQKPSILLPERAARSTAPTGLQEATHMLKISPGPRPDFSAHYGTELLTDDLNSLACENFVHALSWAARPRSWPRVLAAEPTVLFTGIKMSGSSVRPGWMLSQLKLPERSSACTPLCRIHPVLILPPASPCPTQPGFAGAWHWFALETGKRLHAQYCWLLSGSAFRCWWHREAGWRVQHWYPQKVRCLSDGIVAASK